MQILVNFMRAYCVKIPTVHKVKYYARKPKTQGKPLCALYFFAFASFFNQNSTGIISPQPTLEVKKLKKMCFNNAVTKEKTAFVNL